MRFIWSSLLGVIALVVSLSLWAMGADYSLAYGVPVAKNSNAFLIHAGADLVIVTSASGQRTYLVRTDGHFFNDLDNVTGVVPKLSSPDSVGEKLLDQKDNKMDLTKEYGVLPAELKVTSHSESQIVATGMQDFLESKDIGHAVFKTKASGKRKIVAVRFTPEPDKTE